MVGKSVHWVGVVSDRIAKGDVETEVKETGITMPVLIDAGDALYGKLGVALEPVVGITDKDRRLVAYQPFTKVNYAAVIRARIRHLLKEITDKELAAVIDPPAALNSDDLATAQRRLKLAERLFEARNYAKALENVNAGIEKDPKLAAAHALRGDILAAQGKFPEASEAFDRALKLDPKDARALEGMKSSKERKP
jgi:tetratricopeptide (TPR) repeat protein